MEFIEQAMYIQKNIVPSHSLEEIVGMLKRNSDERQIQYVGLTFLPAVDSINVPPIYSKATQMYGLD